MSNWLVTALWIAGAALLLLAPVTLAAYWAGRRAGYEAGITWSRDEYLRILGEIQAEEAS